MPAGFVMWQHDEAECQNDLWTTQNHDSSGFSHSGWHFSHTLVRMWAFADGKLKKDSSFFKALGGAAVEKLISVSPKCVFYCTWQEAVRLLHTTTDRCFYGPANSILDECFACVHFGSSLGSWLWDFFFCNNDDIPIQIQALEADCLTFVWLMYTYLLVFSKCRLSC